MWRSNDQIAEAAGILSGEVRHVDGRTQQALSDDGETAQSRTGRCRYVVREARRTARIRIYVPRTSRRQRCHNRNIRTCTERICQPITRIACRRRLRQGAPAFRRRTVYGTPAIFHDGKEGTVIRPSIPAPQQLAGQEHLHLRQLQHDQYRRDIPEDAHTRHVPENLQRRIYTPRADGTPS